MKLVRVMNGERSMVTEAPEMMTTVGIFAWVTSWPIASAVGTRPAAAQDVIKIGACLSLTGGFQTVARQALAGAKLYMQLNGDKVAGKKIELIVRDDTGVPDVARRIANEMIVNEKVGILLAGITPTALALGQLVTQAKIPTVVIISGASITVDRSPYMTRTSFTLGQSSMIMGDWAAKNGSKKVVSLVNDWAPGARHMPETMRRELRELGLL